jgi:endonuclease G
MEVVSVEELTARIGADVFPAVPASSKAALVKLPVPPGAKGIAGRVEAGVDFTSGIRQEQVSAKADAAAKRDVQTGSWWEWLLAVLLALLETVVRIVWRA